MKYTILLSLIILVACNNNGNIKTEAKVDTLKVIPDTLAITKKPLPDSIQSKTYANTRFRDVRVERIGEDSFLIRGQGQIFEANFNWIVEDGHEELKKGYQMTKAGAPEWGNFEFGIRVQKKRANSTLMLVIFETSAKDGSRQYELPIVLY
ncbi:Gmad2 immunoglobulin-like domain-containing protein [Flavihumibacter sp.]|uniref:Gmad2 immunoglobulin-like domain-containing protein n=1 Tax=Flavihumibacter sp. TaxID=1913981 RepID=UPI002FC6E7DB